MEMNKIGYYFILAIVLISIIGCKENTQEYECAVPFTISKNLKFIGHKGSGPIDSNQNPKWQENGLTSVLHALKKTDGTEVDIQMSNDSTLWLFHDHEIEKCEKETVNFNSLSDDQLDSINSCNYAGQLLKLTQFDTLVLNGDLSDEIISLDLKVLSNPMTLDKWDKDNLLSYVFNSIDRSVQVKNLKLEIPSNIEFSKAKSITDREVYQVYYDTSSITKEISNLSIPFDISQTYSTRNLQVWTPNNMSSMMTALSSKPKIIQSDNIALISYLTKIRDGKKIQCSTVESLDIYQTDEEFINLIDDTAIPSSETFYYLNTKNIAFQKDQFLVLSVKDKNGVQLSYEAIKLWEDPAYLFLKSKNDHRDERTYSIYIWNKVKSPITLNGELIHYK